MWSLKPRNSMSTTGRTHSISLRVAGNARDAKIIISKGGTNASGAASLSVVKIMKESQCIWFFQMMRSHYLKIWYQPRPGQLIRMSCLKRLSRNLEDKRLLTQIKRVERSKWKRVRPKGELEIGHVPNVRTSIMHLETYATSVTPRGQLNRPRKQNKQGKAHKVPPTAMPTWHCLTCLSSDCFDLSFRKTNIGNLRFWW